MTKTKRFIFFFEKPVSKQVVITNSLKTLDFVTTIPLTPYLDNNVVIFGL